MSTDEFQIRPAEVADLEGIFALERSIVTAPHWPRQGYQAILAADIFTPERCMFAAACTQSGGLLGFAVGVVYPAGDAELESIAVAESARRRGVAQELCRKVAAWCQSRGARELLLEVRASSAAPIALYTKLGFAPVGHRPRYYKQPEEDAIVMRLGLQPQ
jgi:ribosomal protein S18 acetylase RimI-like enzyme